MPLPSKTPAGHAFYHQNPALMQLIVQEWQESTRLSYQGKSISQLLITAIDKTPLARSAMEQALTELFSFDLLVMRSPDLQEHQGPLFDALLKPIALVLGESFPTTDTLLSPMTQDHTVTFQSYLDRLSNDQLTGFHHLSFLLKSPLLAIGLLEKCISPEEAWAVASFEDTIQQQEWGKPEDHEKRDQELLAEYQYTLTFLHVLTE